MKTESSISIKTPAEIEILREAGKILAEIVQELKCSLKAGITTKEIDLLAERLIRERKVLPAFKGYRGYPCNICVSINNEVVHGIPSQRILQSGDLVSLDVGIIYKDYYSDTAETIGIDQVSPQWQKLLDVTNKALFKGIEHACVNNHLSDISYAIQIYVESHGFSIVREFVGHGIGRYLHEDPEIPNFGEPHTGPILKEGMVFAIEPMVNLGQAATKILEDGWTVSTRDGEPSAHFEHTVAITHKGPQILTQI